VATENSGRFQNQQDTVRPCNVDEFPVDGLFSYHRSRARGRTPEQDGRSQASAKPKRRGALRLTSWLESRGSAVQNHLPRPLFRGFSHFSSSLIRLQKAFCQLSWQADADAVTVFRAVLLGQCCCRKGKKDRPREASARDSLLNIGAHGGVPELLETGSTIKKQRDFFEPTVCQRWHP